MFTSKIYLIIVTTLTVVNGKTVDERVLTKPTQYASYGECSKAIKSDKRLFAAKKRANKKKNRKRYSYKKIECEFKLVKKRK